MDSIENLPLYSMFRNVTFVGLYYYHDYILYWYLNHEIGKYILHIKIIVHFFMNLVIFHFKDILISLVDRVKQ